MPTFFNCFKAFLVLFIFHQSAFSQQENSYWYFGEYAGISFSSNEPVVLSDGNLSTWEGCASISSLTGDLLFSTDGMTVYNRNHEIMENGNGLAGDPSSTQSALIIPMPETQNTFLIFTIDDVDQNGGVNGLNYSKVDMTLDDGKGGIVAIEKNINLTAPLCEKLTATMHANGIDTWVISQKWGTNDFYAYLGKASGVNTTPVISSEGIVIGGSNIDVAKGYLKASPDGTKLAKANAGLQSVEVFDFDNSSGIVSNGMVIENMDGEPYGIEFSPSGRYLYVNTWKTNPGKFLFQYDLESGTPEEIINSEFKVAIGTEGALQLAPDGRIYVANAQTGYLGRINQPNKTGVNCEYENNAVFLDDHDCMWGLPNFMSKVADTIVGFSDLKATENYLLSIYPNPVSDRLTIKLDNNHQKITSLAIFNVNGNKIESFAFSSGNLISINTSNWATGVYFAVAYRDEMEVSRTKFIVN